MEIEEVEHEEDERVGVAGVAHVLDGEAAAVAALRGQSLIDSRRNNAVTRGVITLADQITLEAREAAALAGRPGSGLMIGPDPFNQVRLKRIAELADAVIIDEAHHFRNPGKLGSADEEDGGSRYRRLFKLLDGSVRPKSLFLITATPINNRLTDFRHMVERLTKAA